MPFAEDSYTGDGSTREFNISFAYIEESHIKVALNEANITAFTVDTSTSPKKVVLTALSGSATSTQETTGAPKTGVNVLVYRDTPLNSPVVDYTDGSTLIADDLDTSNKQWLYLLQEQDDEQAANIQHGLAGHDAKNDQIINVSDPTAAQHAATKNYVDTNFQPLDAELTELATMGSTTASSLADLTQAEVQILDGATVTTAELNTLDGVTATTAELNILDGVTASTAELNLLDGVTSTTAELNILDGVTATAAEINTLDGITASTAELNTLDGVTASTAEINKLDGVTATTAELNFVDGVTSAIQSQIDGKQPLDAELTELATMPATTASALADLTQAEVQILDGATVTTAELNALDGITSTVGELNILDGVTSNASELNTLDGITASTAELNQLDGKTISGTLTPANTNDIPTSSAVNSYVSGLLNALGGFVAIADENSFPTTNPDPSDNAGTIVSIANAGGMSISSSGVGTGQTTGGTTVTINGFPSTFNSTTIQDGLGLQVQTTSTLNTYTYHKVYAKDEDVRQLSQDVNDFKARYRVGSSNPTTDLDSGDLFFNTGSGKMLVYNGQNTAWEEVQSIGEFFINTISSSSGTGGGSATFNGTAYRFTLSNAPTNAQQLLVSVNGVVQKPNSGTSQPSEGFAIDGGDIIFSSAPATNAPFFIITIGSSVNIGTPSAGTVDTDQLATGAVTNAKISSTAAIAGTKIADNGIGPDQLADTAVTAGSYTLSNITVDAQGRITAASSGTAADPDIITEGDTSVEVVDTGTDGEVRLTTDGTRAMTIDSSQNVGIGTTSPGAPLDIVSNSSAEVLKLRGRSTDEIGTIYFQDNAGSTNYAYIQSRSTYLDIATETTNPIIFTTNTSEAARFDSSQRLLIGTNSSTANTAGDDLQIAGSSDRGLTITSGTTSSANIYLGDDGDTDRCRIAYQNNDDALDFSTNGGGTDFRFGPSGQLGIGGANYGTSGQVLTSQGSSSAPQWADASGATWTMANVAAGSSGGVVELTGIPSDVRMFVLSWNQLDSASNSEHLVELGTSGGYATSGYFTSSGYLPNGSTNPGVSRYTNSFYWRGSGTGGNWYGQMIFTRHGSSTSNNWHVQGVANTNTDDLVYIMSGYVALTGTLTKVRTRVSSGGYNSAGSVTLQYLQT